MDQISFKIPSSEMDFLKWWSKKQAQPLSSIYRNATIEHFRQWKTNILINEYSRGSIGFKKFCNLAGISFQEATLLMQESDIEPPISNIIDEYTSSIADKINLKDHEK